MKEKEELSEKKAVLDRDIGVHLPLFILLRIKPIQVIWYRENQLKLEINK